MLPVIHIPKWIWVWIVIIAIIKICNVISGFAYKKRFISLHTVMNKITGLLLFLLPLALSVIELKYSLIVVCIVATISSIQEGYYIRTGQEVSWLWNLIRIPLQRKTKTSGTTFIKRIQTTNSRCTCIGCCHVYLVFVQ